MYQNNNSAPFYQVLTHALKDEANKTKFKLIYSNVSEKDILLRAELDALQQKFSQTFEIVYLVDNPTAEWTGPVGFITADHIKQNVGPASLGDKIKIFVCGEQGFELRSSLKSTKNRVGPPPQVASLAGKKDGQNQGELDGILKDLGYTQEQVRLLLNVIVVNHFIDLTLLLCRYLNSRVEFG